MSCQWLCVRPNINGCVRVVSLVDAVCTASASTSVWTLGLFASRDDVRCRPGNNGDALSLNVRGRLKKKKKLYSHLILARSG